MTCPITADRDEFRGADRELLEAAHKAAATIQAFYQWIDMIEDAGGCTSIAGIAKANAFVTSMKNNRARLDKLIVEPLNAAIAKAGAQSPQTVTSGGGL